MHALNNGWILPINLKYLIIQTIVVIYKYLQRKNRLFGLDSKKLKEKKEKCVKTYEKSDNPLGNGMACLQTKNMNNIVHNPLRSLPISV